MVVAVKFLVTLVLVMLVSGHAFSDPFYGLVCQANGTSSITLVEYKNGQQVPFDCDNTQVEVYGEDLERLYLKKQDYDTSCVAFKKAVILWNEYGVFDIYINRPGYEEIVILDYTVEKSADGCRGIGTVIEVEFFPE